MPSNVKLNVIVPAELERFAREEVRDGHFASVDDVMVAGLRIMEAMATPATGEDFEHLRAKLKRAATQADRGEFVDPDETLARIESVKAGRP